MNSDPLAYGLPHRAPFVFVHCVEQVAAGEKAVCSSTFELSESFFAGHFPGNPIVPGVILTEALAQTAGIAAGPPSNGGSYLLSAIRSMKFPGALLPGERVQFEAVRSGGIGPLQQFEVTATCGPRIVAEGSLVLSEVTSPGE